MLASTCATRDGFHDLLLICLHGLLEESEGQRLSAAGFVSFHVFPVFRARFGVPCGGVHNSGWSPDSVAMVFFARSPSYRYFTNR